MKYKLLALAAILSGSLFAQYEVGSNTQTTVPDDALLFVELPGDIQADIEVSDLQQRFLDAVPGTGSISVANLTALAAEEAEDGEFRFVSSKEAFYFRQASATSGVVAATGGGFWLNVPSVGHSLDEINRRIHAKEVIKIVCLGDSTTLGFIGGGLGTAATPYPDTLEALLSDYAETTDLTVVNEGTNSEDSREALTKVAGVVAQNPDLVIISYGINDASSGAVDPPQVTLTEYIENLTSMVLSFRKAGAAVAFATPPPRFARGGSDVQDHEEFLQRSFSRYVKAMKALGARLNVPVADVTGWWWQLYRAEPQDFSRFQVDHLHPTQEGYDLMAQTIFLQLFHSNNQIVDSHRFFSTKDNAFEYKLGFQSFNNGESDNARPWPTVAFSLFSNQLSSDPLDVGTLRFFSTNPMTVRLLGYGSSVASQDSILEVNGVNHPIRFYNGIANAASRYQGVFCGSSVTIPAGYNLIRTVPVTDGGGRERLDITGIDLKPVEMTVFPEVKEGDTVTRKTVVFDGEITASSAVSAHTRVVTIARDDNIQAIEVEAELINATGLAFGRSHIVDDADGETKIHPLIQTNLQTNGSGVATWQIHPSDLNGVNTASFANWLSQIGSTEGTVTAAVATPFTIRFERAATEWEIKWNGTLVNTLPFDSIPHGDLDIWLFTNQNESGSITKVSIER